MTKIIRHEKNPFVDGMTITTKKQRVTIGSGDDVILNQSTGEVSATNVVAIKEVDDSQFVKLFTQNIGLMMNFKAQGNKAFGFLMWIVQRYGMRKDLVQLDVFTLEEFTDENKNMAFSERTMYQGIKQLEEAKIIARAKKQGFYYINPNFIFNGDRIRFVTEIRKKSTNKHSKLEDQGQQRLLD